MKINLFNDDIGYVKMLDISNANTSEKCRIKYIAEIARVCVDSNEEVKTSQNPEKIYQKLLSEAAPNAFDDKQGKASRALEFIPVVLKYKIENDIVAIYLKSEIRWIYLNEFLNSIARFSYCTKDKIYTNLRTLANIFNYENIPYNTPDEIQYFKAIKIKVPMFVWAQLRTHSQLSFLTKTSRKIEEIDYWFPEDFDNKFKDIQYKKLEKIDSLIEKTSKFQFSSTKNIKEYIVITQERQKELFKALGYKAQINQRAVYYMQYKVCNIAGWSNDEKRWQHLFIERNTCDNWNNWTQPETQLVVKAIKELFENQKSFIYSIPVYLADEQDFIIIKKISCKKLETEKEKVDFIVKALLCDEIIDNPLLKKIKEKKIVTVIQLSIFFTTENLFLNVSEPILTN